jgi:hypothetical protein
VSTPRPGRFNSGKDLCTGGWVGRRIGLEECKKSRPLWDFSYFVYSPITVSYKLYNIPCQTQPVSAYTAIDFNFSIHDISSVHSKEYWPSTVSASFLPTFQTPFVAGCASGTSSLQTPCTGRSYRLQDFQIVTHTFHPIFLLVRLPPGSTHEIDIVL